MITILSIFLALLMPGLSPSSAQASIEWASEKEATQSIREAAHATDEAWEEFHTAAIQGTLASPVIQVTIENQLHEARSLLMNARVAQRAHHYQVAKDIVERIKEITQNIIQASRKRKQ